MAHRHDVFKPILSTRTKASELRSILQHAPPHTRASLLKRQNVVYISRNCRLPAENVEKDLDAP